MSFLPTARRFTREDFTTYLAGLESNWHPSGVTMHHTASPSLAQRPNGFSPQHLINLKDFYQHEKGWSSGPHFFVDDQGDGIILFCALGAKGVHAVSFNSTDWGIEVLGDYDEEDPLTGRGMKCWQNAAWLARTLMTHIGEGAKLHFHRDDPKTSKTCPGTKVTKEWVRLLIDMGETMHTHSDPPMPAHIPRPVLQKGSSGPDVRELQNLLGVKVDGNFGPITHAAVVEFQFRHKLLADGIVGRKTWAALGL